MSRLELYLYWRPNHVQLDPVEVGDKLIAFFPGSRLLARDLWLDELRRLEELNASEVVLDNLRRRWKREGPRISFEISDSGLPCIQGHFNRYIIQFRIDSTLTPQAEGRIIEFLKSFGLEGVRRWREGKTKPESLA